MQVRSARAEDAQAIGEIRIAAWRAAYGAILRAQYLASLDATQGIEALAAKLQSPTPSWRAWVCESNGVLQGFVIVGEPRYKARLGTLELWALNVHPHHWRLGAGRQLVRVALEEAQSQGRRRLELWCIDANARAASLYESAGLVRTGEMRTNVGFGGHRLTEVAYESAFKN